MKANSFIKAVTNHQKSVWKSLGNPVNKFFYTLAVCEDFVLLGMVLTNLIQKGVT